MNKEKLKENLMVVGPGIAVAATGVGAGDMVAAAVSGAKYGMAVVWAVIIGTILKYFLSEGVARWQMATDQSLLEGWIGYFGPWVKIYFMVYLIFWSVMVSAALIVGAGMGAHALLPQLSVNVWAIIHSLVIMKFVFWGRYHTFENVMKIFVGLMFVSLIGCAFFIYPPHTLIWETITEASIPSGSSKFLLGVIGGVGGTLTLLSYGYWIREKNWKGRDGLNKSHLDLRLAYVLTGLFGMAIMVLAAKTLFVQGVEVKGTKGVLQMAMMLEPALGTTGKYLFLLGFWAAVTTSMLGVYQSIPYLYCDFICLLKNKTGEEREAIMDVNSKHYRRYLIFLAVPPLLLLFWGKPVGLIIMYSIVGSMFMPFLAGTLLILMQKNKIVPASFRYRWPSISFLILSLVLFLYLSIDGLTRAFNKI